MLALAIISSCFDCFDQPQRTPVSVRNNSFSSSIRGTRTQVYKSMEYIARGHPFIMMHRLPEDLCVLNDKDAAMEKQRLAFFEELDKPHAWTNKSEMDPVFVPGTYHPYVVSSILLEQGWCIPSQKHWVPNFRFFELTESGYESLREARDWWNSHTRIQKILLMVKE